MNLVTLYRVQHRELKYGPWNAHLSDHTIGWNGDWDKIETARLAVTAMYNEMPESVKSRHVTAWQDFMGWNERYVCAAESIEQLKEWFKCKQAYQAMLDAGFTVVMVKVPFEFVKTSRSRNQMAYDMFCVEEETDLGLLTIAP